MILSCVGVFGSRDLPARYMPAVVAVVSALAAAQVVTTCGSGPCAFIRSAVPAARVFAAADYPASSWGGRLVRRAEAAVRSVAAQSGACVFFLSSPSSVGSLREARLAVSLGVPVFVFCCGSFSGEALPGLGAGAFVRVTDGAFCGAWQWQPAEAQLSFF